MGIFPSGLAGSHWHRTYLWSHGTSTTLPRKVHFALTKNHQYIYNILDFSQVSVDHESISLLFSARALGVTLACLTSGQAFGMEWMKSAKRRIIFLAISQITAALCLLIIPFTTNYYIMLIRRFLNLVMVHSIKNGFIFQCLQS